MLKVILVLLFLIFGLGLIAVVPKGYFYQQNQIKSEEFTAANSQNILLLGQPGPGHYGADNTDSIILVQLRAEGAHFIYVPRDLIVKLDGQLYKINSLFLLNRQRELLQEVARLTNLPVKHYIVFDLQVVKKIIDAVGGIDIEIKRAVVDAVSGYTLAPGRHHLNGNLAEFVLRSRFAFEGDFFRMSNQLEIIKSLLGQIESLSRTDMLKLVQVVQEQKRHYQSDLNPLELLEFLSRFQKIPPTNIHGIILGFDTNLWNDGNFNITLNNYQGRAYGLIPKEGVGQYFKIRTYIGDAIRSIENKKTAQEPKEIYPPAKSGSKAKLNAGGAN